MRRVLILAGGHYGVVQVDGDKWREQRRFSLHLLRNFGVGRPEMEESILIEVSHSCVTYVHAMSIQWKDHSM